MPMSAAKPAATMPAMMMQMIAPRKDPQLAPRAPPRISGMEKRMMPPSKYWYTVSCCPAGMEKMA